MCVCVCIVLAYEKSWKFKVPTIAECSSLSCSTAPPHVAKKYHSMPTKKLTQEAKAS